VYNQKGNMKNNDKNGRELTMGAGKANIYALILALPILIVFGLPFLVLWEGRLNKDVINSIFDNQLLLFGILIFGILAHELIHGVFWMIFSKKGKAFESIKFGVIWKFLTPYCHCKYPLSVKHYRVGGSMPGVILGVIPLLLGLATGNSGIFIFGIFFTVTACGDFLILWMLRKENKRTLVQDHPSKIGCYIIDSKPPRTPARGIEV